MALGTWGDGDRIEGEALEASGRIGLGCRRTPLACGAGIPVADEPRGDSGPCFGHWRATGCGVTSPRYLLSQNLPYTGSSLIRGGTRG